MTAEQWITLRLSVQRALLGVLVNSIVGITANIEGKVLTFVVYFDGVVSDLETELTSEIAGEVIADFPNTTIVESALSVLSDPLPKLGQWILLKAGYPLSD